MIFLFRLQFEIEKHFCQKLRQILFTYRFKVIFGLFDSIKIQILMQTEDPNLKIIIVQSPINQISGDMLFDKLQPNRVPPPRLQSNRFQEISQRLENNLKKIENIENKYDSNKVSINFKMLRHKLVNGTNQKALPRQKVGGYQVNTANKEKYRSTNKLVTPTTYNIPSQRRNTRLDNTSRERTGSVSGSKRLSLEACLKEIGEMRKTVKALKQGCKKQIFPEKHYPHANGLASQSSYLSAKKQSNNVSKYSYTNYRDLSNRKNTSSQDRFAYSQRKFNWIRNPKIQQFTIDVGIDQIKEVQ